MMNPSQLDLTVWRNAPFPTDTEIGIPFDLTGQRIVMQTRLYDGAPGDALFTISSDPTETDYIEIVSIDTVAPETVFKLHITKGTHEGMPQSGRAGVPVTFRHDIMAGPTGFEEPLAYGNYTLMPGVTR